MTADDQSTYCLSLDLGAKRAVLVHVQAGVVPNRILGAFRAAWDRLPCSARDRLSAWLRHVEIRDAMAGGDNGDAAYATCNAATQTVAFAAGRCQCFAGCVLETLVARTLADAYLDALGSRLSP